MPTARRVRRFATSTPSSLASNINSNQRAAPKKPGEPTREPITMPSTLPGTIDAVVDLNHNNAIDMVKAANNGIVAVIHKASESASFKDPAYIKRRAAALDAGLLW